MNLEPYSFCYLRYFHEPLSGEFANVGVLIWAPKSQTLLFQGTEKFSRLSKFFANFHKDDYRKMMKRIESRFKELSEEIRESSVGLILGREPETAHDLGVSVIPVDSAALQWSQSGGGLCASPEAELASLYHEQIEQHYDVLDSFRRDEAAVYRAVYREAFNRPQVKEVIKPHEISAPLAKRNFEQAWRNGVWNVYQTLSFDLLKPDDIRQKAYRWHAESNFLAESAEKHQLHLLLGGPQGRNGKAFGDACKVLESGGNARIIREDAAGDFAEELEAKVREATEAA